MRQRKRHADRKVGCAEGDRRAEAQLDKGMSQTKVKSRMYASKLLTERSPVVKRVMVAETNNDRGAKGSCLHGVSNRDGGMRLAGKAHHAKRRKTMHPESDYGWCDAPRSSLGETRGIRI